MLWLLLQAPTPEPVTIAGAIESLGTIGLGGVITLGATLWGAGLLYRRFRK